MVQLSEALLVVEDIKMEGLSIRSDEVYRL
jgi:hypothetical protein